MYYYNLFSLCWTYLYYNKLAEAWWFTAGFVVGLAVVVAWRGKGRERERERERESESKYKCNLFFLVVYDGYCGGFVGWWWRRMVVCVAVVAACRGT